MERLYINSEADRLTVAAILVKNKYTVRQGSQRRATGRSYDYFLEYGKPSTTEEKKDDG